MAPGKDALSPDPDDDVLNVSFPGLNQAIQPHKKRIELMQFFEK